MHRELPNTPDTPSRKKAAKRKPRKTSPPLVSATESAAGSAQEILLRDIRDSLLSGDERRAWDYAEAALREFPALPEARLLHGLIQRNRGQIALAMKDWRIVIVAGDADTAVQNQARLWLAQALEDQHQYQAAWTYLDNVDAAEAITLRQRLERRLRGEPYLFVQPQHGLVMQDTLERVTGIEHQIGIFGVLLRATGRVKSDYAEWSSGLLTAAFEFVATLGGLRHLPGDPVLALRLISHPAAVADRGRLQIGLLVRVSAATEAECRDQGEALWSMLRDVLPSAHDHVYSLEPIADEAELQTLLMPFEPATCAEIVRRQKIPARHGDAPMLYPLLPGTRDMQNLCWALLRQKTQAMISVHLVPTDVMEWERTVLHSSGFGGHNQMAEPESIGEQQTDVTSAALWWRHDEVQWAQSQGNRDILASMQGLSFVLRVNVATSAGANPLIPEIVAATFFAPIQSGGTAGGYEIVRAHVPEDLTVALRNLNTIDVERWGYPAGDSYNRTPRLRYLVGDREAAYCFRLPIPTERGIPGVPVIDAKPVTPPIGLPSTGMLLGESVARINGVPLRITQAANDRRRHTYICGKTGVGKSTLLLNTSLQDIENGHGVCVIDPHGDLIDDILLRIPADRAGDVILFDPSDIERPIGLNFLEWHTEQQKHQIVTEFIGLLMRMYDPRQIGIVGPRFQHNVRNAMLTAMCEQGNTLIEVVRVLTDIQYVRSLLPKVTDPLVRNYWEQQIATTSDFHKSEILDYLVSKFNRFCGDSLVRNIIGQHSTTLNFREIMNERKILLVNLSKGRIGPENAQFLGLLIVQSLLMTALSRADMPPDERPEFYLYVDEFQNFATELFATILSEGRKYGVAAIVANQYLSQLDGEIRDAIFGNVGSLICFRVGTHDAPVLQPEMYPVFTADDLLNLPRYTACVKLLVDGIAERPFTMRTIPDNHAPDSELAASLRHTSRLRYGQDAAEIGAEILSRFTWIKKAP